MDPRSGALKQDDRAHRSPEASSPQAQGPNGPHPRTRSRMRAVYFGVASFWGFIAGTVAVAAVGGRMIALSPGVLVVLVGAAAVAIVGGVVVALAYREAAHRRLR